MAISFLVRGQRGRQSSEESELGLSKTESDVLRELLKCLGKKLG